MPYAVPNVPGVPAIDFAPVAGIATTLLTADNIGAFASLFSPQWGVFQDGAPVIVADTVADLGYQQEWAICDYPVEEGAFASYNKVQIPFQSRVRFAAGGSDAARSALLASIEAIAGDLNFYDVCTPEKIYTHANLVRYDYRRVSQNGVSLLLVDVTLQEVRVATDSGTLSNTQSPNGADQSNGGTVQPVPATPAQAATATSAPS